MMGRIYLPAEMLDARGITTVDPDSILASPALGNACADLSLVAKENFEVAREALQNLNWRTVRPALLMMGVYQEYLQRLESRGWDEVTEPLKLSSFEKLTIAARWALAPPVVV
jgi:phytoene synthase